MATASSGTAKVTLPADNQILIEREFAAPARLVWRAGRSRSWCDVGGTPVVAR